MESHEYQTMARHERTYWWYRAQRGMILDEIVRLAGSPSGRSLDVGCGTGFFARELASRTGHDAWGIDVTRTWEDSTDAQLHVASANALPFVDETFSLVTSVDVICCAEVDPVLAVREMSRVLNRDGHLVLAVPAYQWMRSVHDEAVHCVRRFNRDAIAAIVRQTGLSLIRSTYLFPSLFPIMAAVRLGRRILDRSTTPTSDIRPIPRPLNEALFQVCELERVLLARVGFPFGSTLLTVARKP